MVRIPEVIARFGAWLGELVGNGPVGITMWRMLNLGNVATDESISGVSPLSLKEALDLAVEAARKGIKLPARYHQYYRWWFGLGWPAFIAVLAIFYLMVAKPRI